MKSTIKLFLPALIIFMFSVSAAAGEKEGLGLLFKTGSLNSVGASYNVSDTTTLRASFGLSVTSSETETQYAVLQKVSQDTNSYNVSLGLLVDLMKKKDLTLYGGIEVGYVYSITESNASPQTVAGGITISQGYEEKNKTNGYTGNLLLGVHHKIGKKFAVFGEIGFGVLNRKRKNSSLNTGLKHTNELTRWDLSRSGIGLVFYL